MKKFKIAAAMLGLTLLLSGCGLNAKAAMNESNEKVKVTAAEEKEVSQQNQEAGTAESQNKAEQQGNTQQQGNTRKQEKADFVGAISEIVGNEITLKLVKMPEMPEMPQSNAPRQNKSKQDSTSKDSATAEKKTPKAITGSTDSGFPGGPGGPGFPGGGKEQSQKSNASSAAANSQKSLDLEYTGEEKTVTLPVGMSISSGRGQQGGTFETLQKGNVISIWLDDSGSVERASLISGGAQ